MKNKSEKEERKRKKLGETMIYKAEIIKNSREIDLPKMALKKFLGCS